MVNSNAGPPPSRLPNRSPEPPTDPDTRALAALGALDALSPTPCLPSPLTEVYDERFARHGIRLLLKRDDLIHPALPGNKWRKLAPNLITALDAGHSRLLTFGGAWSNHLRATAAAGRLLGLATVGVVRGDELADRPLNPSLAGCADDGMFLHFVSRAAYRRRDDHVFLAHLADRFGDPLIVPEGGSNPAALRGCVQLGRELRESTDVAAVACGTGGTLAGLAAGLAPKQRALGVPVLKGGFLGTEVAALQRSAFGSTQGDWSLDDRFHCAGYARIPRELDDFAADFALRHTMPPVERVHVAKLLYGLTALAEGGGFAPGSTVTAVISGGCHRQGITSQA